MNKPYLEKIKALKAEAEKAGEHVVVNHLFRSLLGAEAAMARLEREKKVKAKKP